MLNQSFSAANFRKILDIENRRGTFLEGDYFPEVAKLSKKIQSHNSELRSLKKKKAAYSSEDFESETTELSQTIHSLKEEKERLLLKELNEASSKILSKEFSFGIKKIDVGKEKKVFTADRNAATFFALKQVQHNIRRLYKVKQANRHQIICQLRELLGDGFPKYVIRTDIASFYESIPRTVLLKKLRDDPLLTLTSKTLIRRILFEYSNITGRDVGLPRGIGISAYLAELYMRDMDYAIRDYPGVLYYSRYVDDIFIIFCPPPNIGTSAFRRVVANGFKSLELKRNRKKTRIFYSKPGVTKAIQYLGYKFEIGNSAVDLRMTDKKVTRYKQRINLTFSAYDKQSRTSEKKARALLEKRVRFLTGNTRLVNNKKNVVSGIFFSNPLLNKMQDLKNLDSHLRLKVLALVSLRLKNRLLQHTFEQGYITRKYHKFSAQDLSRIVKVWKHVS